MKDQCFFLNWLKLENFSSFEYSEYNNPDVKKGTRILRHLRVTMLRDRVLERSSHDVCIRLAFSALQPQQVIATDTLFSNSGPTPERSEQMSLGSWNALQQ